MKVINIGGKDYTFEFTIEASLYNECTEKTVGIINSMNEAKGNKSVKDMISTMSDIPQTTLTMFYAALLEHHGEDGDGSVINKKEAKKLIKQYFAEHTEDEKGNFYSVMELMIEIMEDDGFFKQIGLEQMADRSSRKQPKTPQDHKKKTADK